jgi:hypothetical protein
MKPQSAKTKKKYKCRRCKQDYPRVVGSYICNVCKTRCSTCGDALTPTNIYNPKEKRKNYQCKSCICAGVKQRADPVNQKDYDLRRNYGITLAEYNILLEKQEGKCWICSREPAKLALSVDHKHLKQENKLRKERGGMLFRSTVRGLLCWHCNHAIGKFNDNPDHLRRAAEYLETCPAQKILEKYENQKNNQNRE